MFDAANTDTATTDDDAMLRAAAARLAECEEEQRAASEALAAARAEQDNVAARISAMAAERSAIAARRAGGDRRDEQRLALIASDLGTLEGLRAEADARCAAAATARDAFSRVQDEARLAGLMARSTVGADALRDGLAEMIEISTRLGRGLPAWTPGHRLYTYVARLYHSNKARAVVRD